MSDASEFGGKYYICPSCGVKAVQISGGKYIQTLQCMSCGWSMSAEEWNKLSDIDKAKMYDKATERKKKLFGK